MDRYKLIKMFDYLRNEFNCLTFYVVSGQRPKTENSK